MAEIKVSSWNLITAMDFWRENRGGGWCTLTVLCVIFLWQVFHYFLSIIRRRFFIPVDSSSRICVSSNTSHGIAELVSEADLKSLIDDLDENFNQTEKWENVIDKSKSVLSYKAKCCKLKEGPIKYLSVSVFENCSAEVLRDFYMDCEYRKHWDKTVVQHQQLQIDEKNGIEVGRTIKKFPLLTQREYVLAWKIWEGNNKTFYCFTKDCEHPAAPRQKKFVRVAFFRSGWRIRQVPGRNACEVKMVHQEDAGLNVEMAKLAFAKGIWGYVCKMDDAMRKYSSIRDPQSSLAISAVSFIQKVPPKLEHVQSSPPLTSSDMMSVKDDDKGVHPLRLTRKPSKKMIANGLLLAGGLICLSRGNSGLCAKVAVAYILKKFSKRVPPSSASQRN